MPIRAPSFTMPRRARLLLAVLACAPTAALAQDAGDSVRFVPSGRRNSLRFSMGLSLDRIDTETCGGCVDLGSNGAGGRAAVGWPVGRHVVVAYEIARTWRNGWYYFAATPDNPPQIDTRGGLVSWYPPRMPHLALQASVARTNFRFAGGYAPSYDFGRKVELDGWAYGVGATLDGWWSPSSATGIAPSIRWIMTPKARGTQRPASGRAPVPLRLTYSTIVLGVSFIVR